MTDTVTRRTVLAAMLAAGSAPTAARAALPSDPDVVVIGAGAAGIAAALTLAAEGRSVVVLEAADRIGGRAFTETHSFGIPYDQGCAWLQGPASLTLHGFARERGYHLLDHSDASEAVFVGRRRATHAERNAYWDAWGRVEAALEAADDVDIAAADALPSPLDWSGTVQSWMGPMDSGVDFTALSTQDYNVFEEYEIDFLIREGLGALVAEAGRGLPVRLGTPATGIDWSGEGVRVATPDGTIAAGACIVTVSTGVLGAGAIRFTPALPVWKAEAIERVPMGLLTKIALKTDGERFGLSDNAWLTYRTPEEMPAEASFFLTLPFGEPLLVGFVGGAFGWELSRAGEAAAVDFVTGELVKLFGSRARDHVVAASMSDWATNPLTRGAYASAMPGHFDARADLARPVGDRVFFAGEAVAGGYIQLCSGAWMSGEATARAVVRTLDRECTSCGPKRGRAEGASE